MLRRSRADVGEDRLRITLLRQVTERYDPRGRAILYHRQPAVVLVAHRREVAMKRDFRLALIADTHMPRGARRLPDECVALMRTADVIVHAGDFTGAETLAEIESIGPPLVAVHGNVDTPEVRARLPERTSFEAGGARIGLIHDAGPRRGRLARLRREFPDADAVIFGHSHLPLHERDGDFQIFNPGSPTERRRAPSHTMGMGTARDGRIELRLVEVSS